MLLSRLITLGFLGSIFAMFRFARYCHLLNSWDLEPEEVKRYQARAQRWLATIGAMLGLVALSVIAGSIIR